MKRYREYSTIRYDAARIQAAVASICPQVKLRVERSTNGGGERALWWELSSCILSSQVPYSLAAAAADTLERSGLLSGHAENAQLEYRLYEILTQPIVVNGRVRKYRFPSVKAAQLAKTHQQVLNTAKSLTYLLKGFESASEARQWLVDFAPGLGPKQASMFLRNVGFSYELAVLDRHVLRYMELMGLHRPLSDSVHSMSGYIDMETSLRAHAEDAKCPVGILDWAIWIVMRVATQPEEKSV